MQPRSIAQLPPPCPAACHMRAHASANAPMGQRHIAMYANAATRPLSQPPAVRKTPAAPAARQGSQMKGPSVFHSLSLPPSPSSLMPRFQYFWSSTPAGQQSHAPACCPATAQTGQRGCARCCRRYRRRRHRWDGGCTPCHCLLMQLCCHWQAGGRLGGVSAAALLLSAAGRCALPDRMEAMVPVLLRGRCGEGEQCVPLVAAGSHPWALPGLRWLHRWQSREH